MDKHAKLVWVKKIKKDRKGRLSVLGWVSMLCSLSWMFVTQTNLPINIANWLAYLSLNVLITALLHAYLAKRDVH
ncbi:DUF3325 family protein [Paraglaciecola mesophila]|uniref:DUF3325 family protein n=1 Tax=Paraglaciecola mesophila TaxID=197222 RepID=UPI003CCC7869